MVVYDLICDAGHKFEGWFKSESDYFEQKSSEQLGCPSCNTNAVHKLPSASYISTGKTAPDINKTLQNKRQIEAGQFAKKLSSYITANTEDVGTQFAEEAKKMHYGETAERNIRGSASIDDVKSLKEEGIEILPFTPSVDKKNLN